MGIALVQHATGSAGGAGSSVSVSLSTNVTAGNLLTVAVVFESSLSITSVTDGANSLTLSTSATNASLGATTAIYYLANAPSGATTLTVNFSSTTFAAAVIGSEWSGSNTSQASSAGASATGNGTSPSASVTDGNSSLLIYTAASGGTSAALTAPGGYTAGSSVGGNYHISDAYEDVSVSGTYTPTWSLTPSGQWICCASAFVASGGAGGGGLTDELWEEPPVFMAPRRHDPWEHWW